MYRTLTSPDPTATLALEDLLPGYVHRDHDARRTARIAHAARLGDTVHRELLGRADAAGVPISAAERTELEAGCLAGGHVRVWHCPVPLTLIDSLYYPLGHVMPPDDPGSLVIWLRPSKESAYLRSVADLWAVMSPLAPRRGSWNWPARSVWRWIGCVASSMSSVRWPPPTGLMA